MSAGSIKTAVPCACGCGVVAVTHVEQHGEEPREAYVEFYESYRGGISGRLRAAWRVVRGKDPWLHCIALDADGIGKLRGALTPPTATQVCTRPATRPISRIDQIVALLGEFWHHNPDWRLGQLVCNVLGSDPFHVEDDKAEAELLRQIGAGDAA